MHADAGHTTLETQIVSGLQAGGRERAHWENKLYLHFFYLIKHGTRKHRLNEEECASAYSDAVISVIDNVVSGTFEGRASLKSFIFQIFSNKCIDLIRKKTTNKNIANNNTIELDALTMMLPDASQDIVSQLIKKNDALLLLDKLNQLGGKCKELLMLFEDGYSDKEIAQQMSYNTSEVVKTTRMRCLEKLRNTVFVNKL